MKMKSIILLWIFIPLLSSGQGTPARTGKQKSGIKNGILNKATEQYDHCWKGFIGSGIPVFIHFCSHSIRYGKYGNIVSGEIIYLNTKKQQPIPLIGYTDSGKHFILSEYAKDGAVTGIIYANADKETLKGTWSKPSSEKTYILQLKACDTLIRSQDITTNPEDIFGNYYYRYGEKGYSGELKLRKINDQIALFYMFSVTSAPARNMADLIDNDTIPIPAATFTYKVPDTDGCRIKVQFFKQFVVVSYPDEDACRNAFGHNATYEGIYYKVPLLPGKKRTDRNKNF
ncbi:hypothetical protein A8C56_21005 [Niabella ginsenosidivorans]|uniref:Uncharacterized protein n=2 Tax=Niabella ginsenosidivorans TaxID=1176587 RepID=A0A1A9I632_9BACT|nr:hypothetical protein A8C56_21005 [Niabella ginsenosidivorans]